MLGSIEEVVVTLGELSEGWRFEQVGWYLIKLVKADSSNSDKYLCIISRKSYETDKAVAIPTKFTSINKKKSK